MQKMYTFFSKMPDQACALTASTLSCAGVENSTRDHDSDFSLMDGRRGELCMQAALQWLLVTLWESGKSITCLCAALHLEHSRFKTAPNRSREHCARAALDSERIQRNGTVLLGVISILWFHATTAASPRMLLAPCTMHGRWGKQAWPKMRRRAARGTHECRQTHVRGNTCPAGILPTVAAKPVLQHAGFWPFTVLPRVVLIAERTTFQAPCRSPDVYSNLEPIGTRASTRVPCPSHGVPGRVPCPSRGTTFEGGLDGGDGEHRFLLYFLYVLGICICRLR
jgi:hypothetical protein